MDEIVDNLARALTIRSRRTVLAAVSPAVIGWPFGTMYQQASLATQAKRA